MNYQIIELEKCDSTNTEALKLIDKNKELAEWTIIYTENQTSGRGRGKNKWFSEPYKNITFSVILKPNFLPLCNIFYLFKVSAISIVNSLKQFSENIKIKWPNDIYFEKYKLGGVLIENILYNSEIKYSVIGIGINVNQVDFFKYNLNATSLKRIINSEKDIDLKKLLHTILTELYYWYNELKHNNYNKLNKHYKENLLGYKQQIELFVHSKNENIIGEIYDVLDNGILVFKENNNFYYFDIDEVEFLLK